MVIGIDVGGSTTKIVGIDENNQIIQPMFITAVVWRIWEIST